MFRGYDTRKEVVVGGGGSTSTKVVDFYKRCDCVLMFVTVFVMCTFASDKLA